MCYYVIIVNINTINIIMIMDSVVINNHISKFHFLIIIKYK